MIKYLNQNKEVYGIIDEDQDVNILSQKRVYLLDYKYLIIRRFNNKEDSDEIGRINFYMISEKHEYLTNFLNERIFQNLIVMMVMDLDKPAYITESFIEWINYVNNIIIPYS